MYFLFISSYSILVFIFTIWSFSAFLSVVISGTHHTWSKSFFNRLYGWSIYYYQYLLILMYLFKTIRLISTYTPIDKRYWSFSSSMLYLSSSLFYTVHCSQTNIKIWSKANPHRLSQSLLLPIHFKMDSCSNCWFELYIIASEEWRSYGKAQILYLSPFSFECN